MTLGRLSTLFRVATCSQVANGQLYGHGRGGQRLAVGVAHGKVYVYNAFVKHVAHGIAAATTHAHNLYQSVGFVFYGAKVDGWLMWRLCWGRAVGAEVYNVMRLRLTVCLG